jgi:hypothetical protein
MQTEVLDLSQMGISKCTKGVPMHGAMLWKRSLRWGLKRLRKPKLVVYCLRIGQLGCQPHEAIRQSWPSSQTTRPGFITPAGSSAFLIARIICNATGDW